MPQLETDAEPRPVSGKRVKAASRASGSAPALALTRDPGAATVKQGGKKRSTSNTVAEPAAERPAQDEGGRVILPHTTTSFGFRSIACSTRARSGPRLRISPVAATTE